LKNWDLDPAVPVWWRDESPWRDESH